MQFYCSKHLAHSSTASLFPSLKDSQVVQAKALPKHAIAPPVIYLQTGHREVHNIFINTQESIKTCTFVFAPHQWLFEVFGTLPSFWGRHRWQIRDTSEEMLAMNNKQEAIERPLLASMAMLDMNAMAPYYGVQPSYPVKPKKTQQPE